MDIERAYEYRNRGVGVIIPVNNITDIPDSLECYRMFVYKTQQELDAITARYPDKKIYVTKFYALIEV